MNLSSKIVLNLRTFSQIFTEIKKGMLITFLGLITLFLLLSYKEYIQWDYFNDGFELSKEDRVDTGKLIRNLGYMSIGSLLIISFGIFNIFSNISYLTKDIDFENMVEVIEENNTYKDQNIKKSRLNDLLKLYENFSSDDLDNVISNYQKQTRNEILIALKVLKNKYSIPSEESLEKIYKHLNFNSTVELWTEVDNLFI